jgi:nucleoid-associated protein YgaU
LGRGLIVDAGRGKRLRLKESAAFALMVAFSSSATSCGKPVLRVADASLGDYYTEQEFKKLRKDQRDEYCAELARQDSAYKVELLDAREGLDALRARSRGLRAEGDSLFALASQLDSKVHALHGARPQAGSGRAPDAIPNKETNVHVVHPGESLWRISRSNLVYGSGARWKRIYEENRERISDPNRIFPGQELTIPR